MKLLLSAGTALSLFIGGIFGLSSAAPKTVRSIHAFEEPLVAVGDVKSADNDGALITALQAFQQRKSYDDVSAITAYLDANAQSPWKFSLLADLGTVYRKSGYYSKAIDAWQQAWSMGKANNDPKVQYVANLVAADLASLLSSLGRQDALKSLLAETKGRTIFGSAKVRLDNAGDNLWMMKAHPEQSFRCGPYALDSIRTFLNRKDAHDPLIHASRSSSKGFSLTQVRDLSNQLKMNYQMAKRSAGASIIVPSVVHWKSGHYAAILKQQGNGYLVKDPTFGQDIIATTSALDDEASGYFLVPQGKLPNGWQAVSDADGSNVWGQGVDNTRVASATTPNDSMCGCPTGGPGMAVYNIFTMLVCLNIHDTPVGYNPPVGPAVQFTVTYNQLEASQPALTSAFNLGPSWTCNWLAYINLPTSTGGSCTINVQGGGQEIYSSSGSSTTDSSGFTNYWVRQVQSQATLWVSSDGSTYERRMPDGAKEVYSWPNATSSPTQLFLTSVVDPKGNAVTLTYDSSASFVKLNTITDALGLSTTLSYTNTGDATKVTEVTDPYGRSASFQYTLSSSVYQLTQITDEVGIQSQFTYGSGSVITQMTTPYGTTTFNYSETPSTVTYGSLTSGPARDLTVQEPDGSQVKAESRLDGTNFPFGSGSVDPTSGQLTPTEPIPEYTGIDSGFGWGPNYLYGPGIGGSAWEYLHFRNTYFWDKKATHDDPGSLSSSPSSSDYATAHIYHFLHADMSDTAESPVVESEKPALENRTWYFYPYQSSSLFLGTLAKPYAVVRCLIPGGPSYPTWASSSQFQAWQYYYGNSLNPSALSQAIEPPNPGNSHGRITNYTYDTTAGIDLTGVTQINSSGGGTDTIKQITYWSTTGVPAHCPHYVTDAAGQVTTYTYNAQGQVTSITPPTRAGHSAETTTYNYTGNFLTSVVGPVGGSTTTITPDTLGGNPLTRVKSIEDPVGFTETYSYDNLDRVTQTSYPDGTLETFSYVNPTTSSVDLDLHSSTDRVGQTTHRYYDSTRHLTSVTDPDGHTTSYGWCSCGMMTSMMDANSNTTNYYYDLDGHLTATAYPGETLPPATQSAYDVVGRLSTYTNKRGDTATYSYNFDNTLAGITYTGSDTTPALSYGYDGYYDRMTSENGIGWSYESAGTLGAGKILTQTNTLTGGSAAVTYQYDEWGRVVNRNIDSANSQTTTFDSLGRVTKVTNLLSPGSTYFGYSYSDATNRVTQMSYPNGQVTNYSYYNPSLGPTGDERLQEITNLNPSSAVLSQDQYTYSADGKIATWQQQTDSNTPLKWTEGYDGADQLTGATLTNTGITSPAITANTYGYDAGGNMTSSSVGGVTRSPTYNAKNQLTGSTPSGSRTIGVTGLLGAAAAVKINGTSATVNSGHYFAGTFTMTPGTTATVPVVATDAGGNSRTSDYSITAPTELTYTSPTYDADGNMTGNGAGQTYTWDAKNELIQITQGTNTYVFSYDALGRRISETDSGTLTKQWVWDGTQMAEERNISNTVTKRFFTQGEQLTVSSTLTPFYYTRDHLGSVREMTDSTGSIQARYDYDPFGRVTYVQGTMASDFQYAGYYEHAASGLNLTLFRAYDPNLGKWLSRDPIGIAGGINLYGYVLNNPVTLTDPMGLDPGSCPTSNSPPTYHVLQPPGSYGTNSPPTNGSSTNGPPTNTAPTPPADGTIPTPGGPVNPPTQNPPGGVPAGTVPPSGPKGSSG